jgi:hypothetical protein
MNKVIEDERQKEREGERENDRRKKNTATDQK